MKLIKRTFEALKYPKGSPERIKLNEESETSEYMPSIKYDVETSVGTRGFRTKKEAQAFLDSLSEDEIWEKKIVEAIS